MFNKLYVLVRGDLTHGQQLAQVSHAVAEFMMHHNDVDSTCACCDPTKRWENETIVVLKTKSLSELESWATFFSNDAKITFAKFMEPDMNSELTAIAAHGVSLPKFLKKLQLA